MTQQQTAQQPDHQEATNVAQDANHSAFEKVDEDALNQVTGGRQNMPTDTTGWTQYTSKMRDGTTRRVSDLKVSPDGKYYSYHGQIRENDVVYLD